MSETIVRSLRKSDAIACNAQGEPCTARAQQGGKQLNFGKEVHLGKAEVWLSPALGTWRQQVWCNIMKWVHP